MLKAVKSFLKENEWEFSKNEKSNIFMFGIGGENGNFQCTIDIKDDNKRVIIYSFCGSNCPKNKQKDMLKLINHINYNLFLGNFEMDQEDGEIRFRTSSYFDKIKPSAKFVQDLVFPNLYAMDKHLPIIMNLIHGGVDINEAIKSFDEEKSNKD